MGGQHKPILANQGTASLPSEDDPNRLSYGKRLRGGVLDQGILLCKVGDSARPASNYSTTTGHTLLSRVEK